MTAPNKQERQTENERMAQSLAERNGEPVEGLRQRISELEEIATDYGMKFQKAQDALKHQSLLHKSQIEAAENNLIDSECHVAELEESLRDKQALLESAEKRIAETNQRNTELTAKIEPMDRRIAELRDWNAGLAQESFTYQQRVAELEARTITVKFEPIPMEELGNRRDGKKHPYMFGAGYNSAVVHCESVLHQACAAAGIGVKGE